MSLTQAVSTHKLCIPDQTEYFTSQWQQHLASQTQGLLTDMQMIVRDGAGWSKLGLHRAVMLPHLIWMEKEVLVDNPVILLPDFSLEVLESLTSLLYSGVIITSPSVKGEDVLQLMEALGMNIPRNCMVINRCVDPGQDQIDTEESYDNSEHCEEDNNNNIGREHYQDPLVDTLMFENQEGLEFSSKSEDFGSDTRGNETTNQDKLTPLLEDVLDNQPTSEGSQMKVKHNRKIDAKDNDPGNNVKVIDRTENITAKLDFDDVIFDDLVLFDEGTAAKTEKDIKDMMVDAAELLEECTAEYLIQTSSSPKIPQSRSIGSMMPHVDQDTAVPYRKFSVKRYEYGNEAGEELIHATGTSKFDVVVDQAMVNNIQNLLKEIIKSDADDDDIQVNSNIVIDGVVPNESVNQPNQSSDNEEVTTDRNDEIDSSNIVMDQLITGREALSQSEELSSSYSENVDEVVTIQAPRKRKVDADSVTPVGEAVVLSKLRRDCRGVCPLCNKEYSIKMLSSHAVRCKGVI